MKYIVQVAGGGRVTIRIRVAMHVYVCVYARYTRENTNGRTNGAKERWNAAEEKGTRRAAS